MPMPILGNIRLDAKACQGQMNKFNCTNCKYYRVTKAGSLASQMFFVVGYHAPAKTL
jgi:hypothetical protein